MLDFTSYIDIPFDPYGQDRFGLNCWALIRLVYKEQLRINLPSYIDEYGHALNYDAIASTIERNSPEWIMIPSGEEQPYDIVLLRVRGLPIHLGTVMGSGYMLHIMKGINSCRESYKSLLWNKRVLRFYRYGK